MANIKYISAQRYQVGWYAPLSDPYENSSYTSAPSNGQQFVAGENAYWNFLGVDGSKIYESWFTFNFTDEKMLNPQQIGSVTFTLRFQFHKDRSSAKQNVPIRCYIFPVDLNSAYKIKTTTQMEKDKQYITYAETKVNFDNTHRLANFNLTIENPASNTYLAVLKIHPDYETSGWNPVVWYGKDAVGGSLNSTTRAWKTTNITPAKYTITCKNADGGENKIAKYDSELGGSYIASIPTASKDYHTFKGWASTDDASTRDENLYKSTGVLGPFTSDTTLYPVFEQNKGILEITCEGITSDNCSIEQYGENNHRIVVNPNKITVTYDTSDTVSISIGITTKPGYWFVDQTEEPFKYDLDKTIVCSISENEKYDSIKILNIEQINYTIQYQIGSFIVEKISDKKYGDIINKKEITQATLKFKNCTELGDFFEVYKSNNELGDEFDDLNSLSEVSIITELSNEEKVIFGELKWKEEIPESLVDRNKNKTNIITLKNEDTTLLFAIPGLKTAKDTFAEINSVFEIPITTFGQTISVTNSQGYATSIAYNPIDNIIDLTQTQTNIWNGIGLGQNFTFIIPEYEPIVVYREADTYTLTPKDSTIELGGSWWTTHQGSPFAEFYLDFFNGASQNLYLDKGITLYPVNMNKKLWVGNKYFDPEFQTWKEGGN